ncbi:inorganic phosphate transporter [Leptolyngbya sp. FACHB-321]|uniref:inorganic phosphate transporter n=1 Tax=Leptolyngbya sp. FACHB-321 TaxID=2692807 RepID=UPI0016873FE7|nr:inorganic phosphate transporter [Leptolyngbya sp. FACHB-321]MBD2039043.1 inorganic phosphate transporter [Leptolyngbya sp. FACHB-321]
MLIFTSLLAFYLAWNLGANDVANSMGTSVGSKAVTLRQALVIAGILEFAGAVLFGRDVSATLATKIVNPALFAQSPQLLLVGMVSVLLTCGLWLNLATLKGLPVSSSHAVVGAIAGFACVAIGSQAVDWRSIGIISLTWVVTPVISGAIAALFYSQIKRWILDQPDAIAQLREWIPWLSAALLSAFGVIVLPTVVEKFAVALPLPSHTISLAIGAIGAVGLTFFSWRHLDEAGGRLPKTSADGRQEAEGARGVEVQLIDDKTDQNLSPSPPAPLLLSPPSPQHSPFSATESLMARFQLLSACFVAFAHGSNDVGNAVAPLAAIVYIVQTGTVPLENFQVPLWILVLGGAGIVAGLAVWGKKVIATIGEGIIPLQPSGGFCAELATATTILLASRLGLPVSTSHALVGGVIGIGLVQGMKSIRLQTLSSIGLAWIVTVPVAAGLGALIFSLSRWLLPFH